MSLDTNLNTPPYFDDFNEEKNYHRVLFKPVVAVQARELTQAQSILQNQIKRFGDNVLQEGTIITGGNFVELNPVQYAKISDTDVNGNSFDITAFKNQYAVGSVTGLKALIETVKSGFESQTPDLNTLYVKYVNTGSSGEKVFNSSENLEIRDSDDVLIDTVTVAGQSDGNAIGEGYGVRCGEGLIYQKGHFIRFVDDITIVSKYDTTPTNVVVGFETRESLINSDIDSSLLDNANGFNNENAPGADRLKLEPALVTKTLTEAADDEEFFALQEYQNGKVIRRRLSTQYDKILDLIEKRSVEQNGNFVVNRFRLRIEDSSNNNLSLVAGPGLAYVEGKRIELVGDLTIDFEKSTETSSVDNQDIVANYGNYLNGENLNGFFDINTFEDIDLVDATANTIGGANIRSLTKEGNNSYKAFIFNVKMNAGERFEDVRSISNADGSTLDIVLNYANNAVVIDHSYKRAVYPIGKDAIKSLDLSSAEYRYRAANNTVETSTSGSLTLNLPAGDSWPYTVGSTLNSTQKNDLIVISNETVSPYTKGDIIDISNSDVTIVSSTEMQIQFDGTTAQYPSSAMNTVVYHYADRAVTAVNNKELKTIYVKIDTATHPDGVDGSYYLGIPDGYALEGVWKGGSYSESNEDVTNEFRLFSNQKDTHYGLSYIAPAGVNNLVSGDKLLVKVKTFRKTNSTNTFFSVNSYPVDDITATLPANKIRTEDIPVYTTDDNQRINLRDAVDIRPYASNTVAYSTTIAGAGENPSTTLDFGTAPIYFIGPNESAEIDFDYYLSRIDRLVIDEDGSFNIIKGEAAENPSAPAKPDKTLSPCLIKVRPYPSLPISTASREDREEYSVFISRLDNKNYYPKDIRKIEDRIKNLETYTSLSLLESKATDLVIQDENGLDRFKNGILVDNFKDLSIANMKSREYSASIDTSYSELLPKFRAYPLDLKLAQSSNVTNYGDVALLSSSNTTVISQSTATAQRSCTTDFWKFTGSMSIYPESDMSIDNVKAPDINFDIDLETPFAQFTESLGEFIPLQRVSEDVVSNTINRNRNTVRRTTVIDTVTEQISFNSQQEVNEIGDFVTDISFNPYLRSREIVVKAFGLRPNTRMYFYFDKKNVNANVAPAKVQNGSVVRNGVFSASNVIETDSEGKLYAIFRIPSETFFVGDRVLEVFDASQYTSKNSSTTYAKKSYHGFNVSASKSTLTTTTRIPEISVEREVDTRTDVTTRTIPNEPGGPAGNGGGGVGDPISQTFIIDKNNSDDTVAYISGVDIFFSTKSDTNGVTVEIREVNNGYPSGVIIPFTRVHLTSSEVNANNTSASEATNVAFDSPVPLKTGKEYAIAIKPDANDPDYKIWISRTGETDVDSGLNVQQDTNAGVLFTSTNNKTWTPYQNENLKFNVYQASFSSANGNIVLTNNNDEFLKVANTSNTTFIDNELVFIDNANTYLTGTVDVTTGNTTIIGTGTQFSSEYEEGEHIIIDYPSSETQVLRIDNIANNTLMVVSDIPTANLSSVDHFSSIVGKVSYYNDRDPKTLILSESTAKTGTVFSANTTLVGADSTATADISEILDIPVSYLQANILKSNFNTTNTRIRGTRLYSPTAGYYSTPLKFNDNNQLYANDTYVKSRSNEILNDSGDNSFEITIDMESNSGDTSPFVDYGASSLTAYEYFINNDSTGEKTLYGNAESKYVTRKIELADGLDAEDMRVLLTTYRPVGTDVEIWAKFQSSSDPYIFDDCTCVAWTKLEKRIETDIQSSTVNRFDYKEIEYVLGETAKGNVEGAWLDQGDTFTYKDQDGAIYNSYKFFAVKIIFKSSQHNVIPRVKDMRAIALS